MKSLKIIPVSLCGMLLALMVIGIPSCKKQDDWLNVKRNNTDVTPKTLQDLQAVLDNNQVMNGYGSNLGLEGTDNVYTPDANLDGVDQTSRNAYLWSKDIYQGAQAFDWLYAYQTIEYANIVLDGLKTLNTGSSMADINNIKGSALFYRSFAFYQLMQLYGKPYSVKSANTDLGIPLRLSSDVNTKIGRASVQATFDQIIGDMKQAIPLLPKIPIYKTRPSSVAATALLAKVYLSMSDYSNALTYSTLTLNTNSSLLNYNELSISALNPFPTITKGHPEVIFHAWSIGYTMVTLNGSGRVAPSLYKAYEPGDLRKTAFFVADGATGYFKFKGSYSANPYNFCGIATDEIYLIHAECLTRTGRIADALRDMNALLKNRYATGAFSPLQITDQSILLNRIILERRKEMPFTGNLRWEDLKRYNMENSLQVQLSRTYHNTFYTLPPNDPRYVFPLPDDEIQLNRLQQNIR